MSDQQRTLDRLAHLEELMAGYGEQIAGLETAKLLEPLKKVLIDQNIRAVRKEAHPYETEYWKLMQQVAPQSPVPEAEAQVVVADIVAEVEGAVVQADRYAPEVMALLQQILQTLAAGDQESVGKLVASLSLMPPFVQVAYETEISLDVDRHFPTFKRGAELVKRYLPKK